MVAAEARGFILGAALARELGAGFVPARKPGKLPGETISAEYALEYGIDALEVHADALAGGRAGADPRRPARHWRHRAGRCAISSRSSAARSSAARSWSSSARSAAASACESAHPVHALIELPGLADDRWRPRAAAARSPPPSRTVWALIADADHMPRWWPGVARVEGVSDDHFTQVFKTKKGRPVRLDFQVVESDPPWRRAWRQEISGTPFERVLNESVISDRAQAGRRPAPR